MSEEQHKTGYELLNKLNDGKSEKMIKKLSGVAPDVSD